MEGLKIVMILKIFLLLQDSIIFAWAKEGENSGKE
jgi:hypothetical protein